MTTFSGMTYLSGMTCFNCGGTIELIAREGRTYEIIKGRHFPIPGDFKIPTCTTCGEEIYTIEISKELDKLIK